MLSGALERLPGGSKLSLSLSKAWALPVFATMLTVAASPASDPGPLGHPDLFTCNARWPGHANACL